MIFNRFFVKRKKQEQTRPERAADYRVASAAVTGIDSTTFNCIDRIASQMAMLNFGVYSRRTRQKVANHWFYAVFRRPNMDDTRFNFLYQSAVDYYNGGIYWLKGYGTNGQLVSLFRLNPAAVMPSRDMVTRQRVYMYNGVTYSQDDIIAVPSRYSYSTLTGGLSIFQAGANAFDTAQKIDQYTKNAFSNGASGKRLVIDISAALPDSTDEQVDALRAKFEADYAGIANAGRPLLKKKSINYETIDTGGTDSKSVELSENRKFQEHEMAKIFSVPDELLRGDSGAMDLENVFTLFLEFAIKPLAVQIQESINTILGDDYYFEFDFNGVMKVSLQKRIDAYQKQINNGMLSLDEVRRMENRPPLPQAGDTYFMPVNMMPWDDETKKAYMAKQKMTAQGVIDGAGIASSDQHSPAGDDKQ